MAKIKELKPSDIQEDSAIIINKKPVIFDFILLFLIGVPFVFLILFGNVDIKSSSSRNQGLTNSWQNISPAFSNQSGAPNVSPSPDKIIPTLPLSGTGKSQ